MNIPSQIKYETYSSQTAESILSKSETLKLELKFVKNKIKLNDLVLIRVGEPGAILMGKAECASRAYPTSNQPY